MQNNAADLSINAFDLINIVFVLTDIDVFFTLGRHSLHFRIALRNLLHGISRLFPSTRLQRTKRNEGETAFFHLLTPYIHLLTSHFFENYAYIINFFHLCTAFLIKTLYLCTRILQRVQDILLVSS